MDPVELQEEDYLLSAWSTPRTPQQKLDLSGPQSNLLTRRLMGSITDSRQ